MEQQLLVEGSDDLHVITAICAKFNVKESFTIKDCNGVDKLLDSLPVRLKGDGETKVIGIVLDADTDAAARWGKLRKILTDSGKYTDIPQECPDSGLVIMPALHGDMTFGAWIMPDNSTAGMIEDFAAVLIPEGDDLIPLADKALQHLEAGNMNRYKLAHHAKARIHTWLAWQETPGTPMGLAITKKYLTTDPPICQKFVDWINCLFNRQFH